MWRAAGAREGARRGPGPRGRGRRRGSRGGTRRCLVAGVLDRGYRAAQDPHAEQRHEAGHHEAGAPEVRAAAVAREEQAGQGDRHHEGEDRVVHDVGQPVGRVEPGDPQAPVGGVVEVGAGQRLETHAVLEQLVRDGEQQDARPAAAPAHDELAHEEHAGAVDRHPQQDQPGHPERGRPERRSATSGVSTARTSAARRFLGERPTRAVPGTAGAPVRVSLMPAEAARPPP